MALKMLYGSYFIKSAVLLGLLNFAVFAQSSFTDSRDGKKYKTVRIGELTWMAENLNYNASGSRCYGNRQENCSKYGMLYDWPTAKKVCPSGWYLPSDMEWQKLVDFLGGDEEAGEKLKAKVGWDNYGEQSGNGADNYGFSALPGGNSYSKDKFRYAGNSGRWWSATEYNNYRAYRRYIYHDNSGIDYHHGDKTLFLSVRCVQ